MHPQDIPVHSSAPPSSSIAPTLQSYHALQQQQQQLGFSATPFQTGYPNGTSGGAAAQHPPQPYSNSANGHPSGGSPADAMTQQQARYSLYDLPTPPDYHRPASHPPAGSSSSARAAIPATAAPLTTTAAVYQPHVNADTEAVNRMIRQAMELTRNANGPAGLDFSSLDRVYDATMAEYAARAANAASSIQQPQLQQQQQQQDPSQVHLDLIRERGNPSAAAAPALPTSSSSAASTSAIKAIVAAPDAKKTTDGSPAQAESNNEQSGTRTAASGPPSSNGVAAAAQEAARVDGESTTDKTAAQADTSKEAAAADSGSAGEKNDAQAAAAATAAQPDVPEHRVGRGPGSRQRWTPEEDQELVAYVQMDPPMTWDEIGAKLGRRATGCSMRWYKYLRDRLDADGNLIGLQYPAPEPKKGKKNKRKGKEDAVAEETAAHEPSQHMVVGSSAGQHEEEGAASASSAPRAVEQQSERQQSETAASRSGSEQIDTAAQAKRKTRSASPSQGAVSKGTRKASAIGTGRLVNLPYIAPDDLPPPLPPAPNKPGHPFPRAPGTRVHSNAGQHYLLKSALVENPPIPFTKNSVIRGRRTRTPQELEEDMKRELEEQKQKREAERKKRAEERKRAEDEAQANGQEFGLDMAGVPVGGVNLPVTLPMKQRSSGPGARGGTSKGGTTAHLCPAENCSAAFKRTEHLRRHYKAVHRGEKPFPCSVAGCAKYFSRKDNLQQHQAMVHFVRALYHFPDGTTSNDPPEPGEPATITFEAVDISRTPRGQQKLKRARGKQADDIFQAIRDATALAARSTAANAGGNAAQQALNAEAAIAGVAAAAMGGGGAPSTQAPNPSQSGEKRGREDDDGTNGADKDAAEEAGHIEKRLRFADYGPMGTDDTSMLDPALQALTADPSGVYGFPVGGFDPTPHDLFASLPPVPSSSTTGQAAYSAAPVASTLAAGSGNGLEMMAGSTAGGSSHGASTGGPSDLAQGGQGGVGSSLVSAQSASPA